MRDLGLAEGEELKTNLLWATGCYPIGRANAAVRLVEAPPHHAGYCESDCSRDEKKSLSNGANQASTTSYLHPVK
jgi:hypothetical protein